MIRNIIEKEYSSFVVKEGTSPSRCVLSLDAYRQLVMEVFPCVPPNGCLGTIAGMLVEINPYLNKLVEVHYE